MARYQGILAYDGTRFAGFQRQAQARTVQGVLEEALRRLGWTGTSILAAGRTDAGVHAHGQVVAFDLDWQHPPEALCRALNAHLPADVAVRGVREVAPDFHPRYQARARQYCYHLFSDPLPHPTRERYAWRVWPQPAPEALQRAATILVGRHDFAAFGRPMQPDGSTVRTVRRAEWLPQPEGQVFRIVADAFLYHMVRRLVYVQVAVAQGRLPLEAVRRALHTGNPLPPKGQGLASPAGLFLSAVCYEDCPETWAVDCQP